MKHGKSSSGCETHPAKVEPDRPVASFAADVVTQPSMRKHANERAGGYSPEKVTPRVQKVFSYWNAAVRSSIKGEMTSYSAGWMTSAREEEDGPVTWDTLDSPQEPPVLWGPGNQSPAPVSPWMQAQAGKKQAFTLW